MKTVIAIGLYCCSLFLSSIATAGATNSSVTSSSTPLVVTVLGGGNFTAGQTHTLTCQVSGGDTTNMTTSYHWLKNNQTRSGQTSSTLSFSPLREADTGQYNCQGTRGSVTNTSNSVVITVNGARPDAVSGLKVSATTATSITITWMVSSTTVIPITGFAITYSYTVRRCSAPPGASRTDSISNGTRRSHTLSGLNEDSDYTITVRAINDVGSSMTTTTTAITNTSAPSAGPTSVTTVTVGVVNITIQWGEVDCADRNGDIAGYKVRHGLSSTTSSLRTVTNINSRIFSVNRLLIRSNYSFEVAAVAGGRTGPYSSVLDVTTSVPTGLGFNLKGVLYSNNSIVNITDIGNGTNALYCFTNGSDCCRESDRGTNGKWFFPDGRQVDENGRVSTLDFNRNRGPSAVLLNRRNNAMGPTGFYRCEVLDARNVVQSIYVGLYKDGVGIIGSVGHLIAGENHMLTCLASTQDSTMMPSYQWLKDGRELSGRTSATLSFSPLRQIDSGRYTCRVMRGPLTSTAHVSINVVVPQFSVTISSSEQPTEGQRCVLMCNVNGVEQSLSASIAYRWDRVGSSSGLSTSQQLTFNPLRRSDDGQYRCTVTISSPYFTGTRSPTRTRTITVTRSRPDPVISLTVTASATTATSITITWRVSSTTVIPISGFMVTYSYTVRRCSAPPGASRTDSISDGTRRSHTLSGLNEDSDYTITVRAINDVGSSMATTTRGTTDTSAPSAGPTSVISVSMGVVDITIQWGEVNCADRNGNITVYKVRHGLSSATSRTVADITNLNNRMFSVNRLLIRSTYSFEVAAVVGGRTGSYSSVHEVNTSVPTGLGFNLKGELYSNNSIVNIANIGSGTNALYCFTNRGGCCRRSDGGANGEWFFPNRSSVEGGGTISMLDFSRSRGPSAVPLNRRNNAMRPTGLYRCEVLDASSVTQLIFIGLYPFNEGAPSVSIMSYSRPSRTLTCISTGGPATNVTWRKDDMTISPSSPSHQQSQRVVDTTTATYHNLLSITSSDIRDYTGSFTCTVSNTRRSSLPMSLDIKDILISGIRRVYVLGSAISVTCSSNLTVQYIQWLNVSNNRQVISTSVPGEQQLVLEISRATIAINDTVYSCEVTILPPINTRVLNETFTLRVSNVGAPRVPEVVMVTTITSSEATIQWTFTQQPYNASRPESYVVLYGTASGQLRNITSMVHADANTQTYSIRLLSLQPATTYHYKIRSRNVIEILDTSQDSFKTNDSNAGPVHELQASSPENSTLVFTWQPPSITNGDILSYSLMITDLRNRTILRNESVSGREFTLNNLVPGAPYNVSIGAVNMAGLGALNVSTYFTKELAPSIAPRRVEVNRISASMMMVSWTPLSLSEARGFITHYTVAYFPQQGSSKRQEPNTMYKNVSGDSDQATIDGLEASIDYGVQVSASTNAGSGDFSPIISAKAPKKSALAQEIGVIVGAILAVILVLVLLIIVIVICVKCRQNKGENFSLMKRKKESDINLKEMTSGIYENTKKMVKDRLKPIPIDKFGEHVQQMHADRDKWFELEYNAIDSSPQAKFDIAEIPDNRARNRFGNIYPYDFNRVVLKTLPNEEYSDYINASYIDGYKRKKVYIGAQGPTENSVEDFWRMIWEYRVPTIVMVTKVFEGKKKCEEYWPGSVNEDFIPQPGSPLTIKLQSSLPLAEFAIRKMTVTTNEPESSPLEITMFHYLDWPDHGVPINAVSMINFIRRVRKTHPYSKEDPLLVHCSAGVGRTGTFITLDYMLERIKNENTINIHEFVCNLRKQRVLMVQTQIQYVFIHNALDELLTCGETEITAANMRIAIGKLGRSVQSGTGTGFQKQYETLEEVTSLVQNIDIPIATDEHYAAKNRYQDKIPYNHTRVLLKPSAVQGSDYINASFVEGYRQKGAYIATQGPLPHTVNDFWRMVWEQEVKCIVMLCRAEEKGEEVCHPYWPKSKGKSEKFGKYMVTLLSQEVESDYTIRKLEILEKTKMSVSAENGFTVTQFQYVKWPEDGVPLVTSPVLEIANLVQKVQMGSGNKAIVVMCNNGVGQTGAFITIHAQMERMKVEAVVDIFQFIKAIRVQRAGLVSTKEQYEFCHQVLADFLDCFETYANFKEII